MNWKQVVLIVLAAAATVACMSAGRAVVSRHGWAEKVANQYERAHQIEWSASQMHGAGKITDENLQRIEERCLAAKGWLDEAQKSLELFVLDSGSESAVQDHVNMATSILDSADDMLKIWGIR